MLMSMIWYNWSVKKYQIILNNGLISQEIEAENGDKLLKKIDSGN